MHGGAFLTCGVNSHGRIATALSKFADSPGAGGQLPADPQALRRRWRSTTATTLTAGCGCRGYEPDQIVLAGDSAGGYLALTLAQRLQAQHEEPAALVAISPLLAAGKGTQTGAPKYSTDAMFPPKAFDALVDLVARAAARNVVDGEPEADLRAARSHRTRPAAHADPRLGFRGAAARCPTGCAPAGRGGRAGRSAGVAGPDSRLPARRAHRCPRRPGRCARSGSTSARPPVRRAELSGPQRLVPRRIVDRLSTM